MKFVLDTNIIPEALIKDSVVRGILLRSNHEFLIPEHAIDETKKHLDVVARKSGLSEGEIDSVMDTLLTNIKVVPSDEVLSKWKEAENAIAEVDEDDVPIVAASMSVSCDGIWSDDRHLKRQNKVRVWTTKDVTKLSGRA